MERKIKNICGDLGVIKELVGSLYSALPCSQKRCPAAYNRERRRGRDLIGEKALPTVSR